MKKWKNVLKNSNFFFQNTFSQEKNENINQIIKESLKSIKEVGTVLPSSKFVVSKMIEPINFEKDISILEFGSGTGVITKEILKKMTPSSKLICFETNTSFQKELKQKFFL